jgi:3-hydroxyacyl-CoA dehydrogenase
MASSIKTVGVLGTGVIGSSWTTLFLAKGLKVIVSDPAPGAQQHLEDFIQKQWPLMQRVGLALGASASNFKFVEDVSDHLDEVDFVQEVRECLKASQEATKTFLSRMLRR